MSYTECVEFPEYLFSTHRLTTVFVITSVPVVAFLFLSDAYVLAEPLAQLLKKKKLQSVSCLTGVPQGRLTTTITTVLLSASAFSVQAQNIVLAVLPQQQSLELNLFAQTVNRI